MHVWHAGAAPLKCTAVCAPAYEAIPAAYYLFMSNQKRLFFGLLGFFDSHRVGAARKVAC